MKTSSVFIPTIAAIAAALVTPATAGEPIPLDPQKGLQVVVHDNIVPRSRDSFTRTGNSYERFLVFRSEFEKAIKAAGYEGPVRIVQFAANIPEAEQRLTVYIYRWETGLESWGYSLTAEFTMEAKLQVGDKEFGLGSFSARESHVVMGGATSEDYGPAAGRAISQMIEYYRNAIAQDRPVG